MTWSPSQALLSNAELIKQGAEAKVYSLNSLLPTPTTYWPEAGPSRQRNTPQANAGVSKSVSSSAAGDDKGVILKYRFSKKYRHPTLDASLTRTRLAFEARALARCMRSGVIVPKVLWVDDKGGIIGMEKISGWSVREVLGGGAEGEVEIDEEEEVEYDPEEAGDDTATEQVTIDESEDTEGLRALTQLGVSKAHLMTSIGYALARLHDIGIIHGDLTTSNMMIRLTPSATEPYEIVLIDFGLSSTGVMPENYAVDLYVLERAFASTHPQSESLYAGVLEAYAKGLGEKKWRPIQSKLKEVRLRGRKRDMTG